MGKYLFFSSHYTVEMIADFAMYAHRSRRGSRGAFVYVDAICPLPYTNYVSRLPLDSVMLLISELIPKLQEFQSSQRSNPTGAILDYLGHISIKHILPNPPPLNPRRFIVSSCIYVDNKKADLDFQWSEASLVWLSSLIWGEVYVRGMTPLGIWNSTSVRLFYVKHTQNPQRPLTETVSNVVGGLLGRGGAGEPPQLSRQ
jgi:High-temperature-induced dauer-formation protein